MPDAGEWHYLGLYPIRPYLVFSVRRYKKKTRSIRAPALPE